VSRHDYVVRRELRSVGKQSQHGQNCLLQHQVETVGMFRRKVHQREALSVVVARFLLFCVFELIFICFLSRAVVGKLEGGKFVVVFSTVTEQTGKRNMLLNLFFFKRNLPRKAFVKMLETTKAEQIAKMEQQKSDLKSVLVKADLPKIEKRK
jgi:hypothetical protein